MLLIHAFQGMIDQYHLWIASGGLQKYITHIVTFLFTIANLQFDACPAYRWNRNLNPEIKDFVMDILIEHFN